MSNLCLYHNNCTDGLIAAYVMYLHFKDYEEECDFIAVNYNEPIPNVNDKNVYISTTKVFCSLRSSQRSNIDVAALANNFSGGGHRFASGFGLTPDELPRLLKGLF